MDELYAPLSILSKAVAYKNLTGASKHIGLSQPQLSRVVKQLEGALNITLLDSSSPRHSSWTPEARSIADVFKQSKQNLGTAISQIQTESLPKEIRIGCLEGLLDEAKKFANRLLKIDYIQNVFVYSHDLNILEAKFISSELDLLVSSRSPKIKKYEFVKLIGYQDFIPLGSKKDETQILSTFEYLSQKKSQKDKKSLITNSLYFKKNYQKEFGGYSSSPGAVVKTPKTNDNAEVLVIGQDYFNKDLWSELF